LEWHSLTVDEVCQRLSTNRSNGLTLEELFRKQRQFGMNIQSPPPSNRLRRLAEYIFGGFGSLLIVAGVLCVIAWRPLGGDSSQADYLALGIILFIVAGVQACFNAWQVFQIGHPVNCRTGVQIE
jgi:sodium/potassium-transporting ATPase subunit alpha